MNQTHAHSRNKEAGPNEGLDIGPGQKLELSRLILLDQRLEISDRVSSRDREGTEGSLEEEEPRVLCVQMFIDAVDRVTLERQPVQRRLPSVEAIVSQVRADLGSIRL